MCTDLQESSESSDTGSTGNLGAPAEESGSTSGDRSRGRSWRQTNRHGAVDGWDGSSAGDDGGDWCHRGGGGSLWLTIGDDGDWSNGRSRSLGLSVGDDSDGSNGGGGSLRLTVRDDGDRGGTGAGALWLAVTNLRLLRNGNGGQGQKSKVDAGVHCVFLF